MNEQTYIKLRKLKAFGNSLCFYLCRIFPIKQNRIAVCTFEGKGGFGCNPKYIVQELHRRGDDYEIVWLVNDMSKEFPDYIKKVPNTLWSRAYWLSTSKVWIDNYRKPLGTIKRKKQYYINTWHANMGFKSIGIWRGDAFSKMAYLVSKNDSKMIDRVIIDSVFCEILFRKGLLYEGEYLYAGQPRCDVLFGDRAQWRDKLKSKYSIPHNAQIVLFAPTFKEAGKNGQRSIFNDEWSIDFVRLIHNLELRFGGSWYLFIRLHPQLVDSINKVNNTGLENKVMNVSLEDDMYELLAGVDAYVTDYSSAAFDAGCCEMPVFIYADDLYQYEEKRGSLLWDYSAHYGDAIFNNKHITPDLNVMLPFSVAFNNDELERSILSFDQDDYSERIKQMKVSVKMMFDGMASKRVADLIDNVVG